MYAWNIKLYEINFHLTNEFSSIFFSIWRLIWSGLREISSIFWILIEIEINCKCRPSVPCHVIDMYDVASDSLLYVIECRKCQCTSQPDILGRSWRSVRFLFFGSLSWQLWIMWLRNILGWDRDVNKLSSAQEMTEFRRPRRDLDRNLPIMTLHSSQLAVMGSHDAGEKSVARSGRNCRDKSFPEKRLEIQQHLRDNVSLISHILAIKMIIE